MKIFITATIFVAVLAACLAALPLLSPDPSYFYFDDFFYYVMPAKHFLAGGGYTFFPGMPTNGFQPLWMAIVTAALFLSGSSDFSFYCLINGLMAILAVETYRQAVSFLREQGAEPLWSVTVGMLVFSLQLSVAFHGMEIALALPLLLRLTRILMRRPLDRLPVAALFATGVLASAVALARLDAILLLLPLGMYLVLRDRLRFGTLAIIGAGLLPVALYCLLDYWLTQQFMPISGQAKMLKPGLLPSFRPIAMLFATQRFTAYVFLLIAACMLAAPALLRPALPPRFAGFMAACCAGVALYYAIYCLTTDWQLFFWYMYPLPWLAMLSGAALSHSTRPVAIGMAMIAAALALLMGIAYDTQPAEGNILWRRAKFITAFIHDHPGTYAMGDCAGIVAYLSKADILQMEGLMGDRAFLENIEHRAKIGEVLRKYHVDYYIYSLSAPVPKTGDCYQLKEPLLAGPASPAMHGAACRPPMLDAESVLIYRADDID